VIPTLIKSFVASADADPFHIAAFSTGSQVAPADADDDVLIGTYDAMGAVSGGMADVILGGIGSVKLGGTVTAGAPLTANADAEAIVCAAAAGETRRYIGFALQAGVDGDIVDYLHAPGLLHEPAA
jgi:hypothetical protein